MTAQEISPGLVIRGITPPLSLHDFRLITFDMDSTLINIECVDEIADAAGRKAEVAAITEAAMRGEIADYKESLRQRVALLRGVTVASMEAVYATRLQLNPGAFELVAACKQAGLKLLLVSGGFTFFTDRIRDRLGIDFTRSNMLEVQDGLLTCKRMDQTLGDIGGGTNWFVPTSYAPLDSQATLPSLAVRTVVSGPSLPNTPSACWLIFESIV